MSDAGPLGLGAGPDAHGDQRDAHGREGGEHLGMALRIDQARDKRADEGRYSVATNPSSRASGGRGNTNTLQPRIPVTRNMPHMTRAMKTGEVADRLHAASGGRRPAGTRASCALYRSERAEPVRLRVVTPCSRRRPRSTPP